MHTKVKRFLLMCLTLALLSGAGLMLGPLLRMREKYDLTSQPVKGLSPQLALATQMLGWGRGIIIDVIWIRLESLLQKNKYFELVQLADWACKLAPRIWQVWDIQSWNLAYNVSCWIDYFPDRWAWVWRAIKLLRDEGIPLNPNAFNLYSRLGWIYFHKLGEQDDNAHMFYKAKFAQIMQGVLGGPGDKKLLKELAETPRTREGLLEDEQVRNLVDLCARHGLELIKDYRRVAADTSSLPDAVKAAFNQPEARAPLHRVALFVRARELRDRYKLEPERMLRLTEKYGPFDWRSPYPHAIYWATVGLEKLDEVRRRKYATAEEFGLPKPVNKKAGREPGLDKDEELYAFEEVVLNRLIYHSLQGLVAHGRLLFDSRGRLLMDPGNDYRFADALLEQYRQMLARYDEGERFRTGVMEGYQHFLENGVIEFYFLGDTKKSREYFELLRKEFPNGTTTYELKDGSRKAFTYDEYINWRMRDYASMLTFSRARTLVRGYLTRAYYYLACDYDDKANALVKEAQTICKYWEPDEFKVARILRFDKIKESVLTDILSGRYGLPQAALGNLKRRLGKDTVGQASRRAEPGGDPRPQGR